MNVFLYNSSMLRILTAKNLKKKNWQLLISLVANWVILF